MVLHVVVVRRLDDDLPCLDAVWTRRDRDIDRRPDSRLVKRQPDAGVDDFTGLSRSGKTDLYIVELHLRSDLRAGRREQRE